MATPRPPRRLLVTGSRDANVNEVQNILINMIQPGDVVVHGACPTGADHAARVLCWSEGIREEPHPADWDLHGRAAGPRRNQEMVWRGADLCVAFYAKGKANRGTADCVRKADAAGIPVEAYRVAAR